MIQVKIPLRTVMLVTFHLTASMPINRPDILLDIPSMLLSSTGPLALKWNYVPRMIPWFLKFIKNCTKKNMMHTAKVYASNTRFSTISL